MLWSTGGSAFGLDAAGGVMKKLEEVGVGRDVMVTVVPNVCAVLFGSEIWVYGDSPGWSHGLWPVRRLCLRSFPFRRGTLSGDRVQFIGKNPRRAVFHEGGASGPAPFGRET